MKEADMTFDDIQNNRDEFLHRYEVADIFSKCSINWDTLMKIGDDYENKCFGRGRDQQEYKGEYYDLIQQHIAKIASFENVHSYRFRIKKTGSLLAKIIRKNVERDEKFTEKDYFQKITDLLGIRILYVFKEDYLSVHDQVMEAYGGQLAQDISIKLKTGDDKEMYAQLLKKQPRVRVDENSTYRSIHYTLYARKTDIELSPQLEIQTRTVFEEGWSEINHKLVYKRNENLSEIKRISGLLSSMVGVCDTLGSIMKMIYDTNASRPSGGEMDTPPENDKVIEVLRKFLTQ